MEKYKKEPNLSLPTRLCLRQIQSFPGEGGQITDERHRIIHRLWLWGLGDLSRGRMARTGALFFYCFSFVSARVLRLISP